MAYYKKRKKYGQFFHRYYDFLLTSSSQVQEKKAEEELEEFLEYIKKNCRFYFRNLSNNYDLKSWPIIDKEIVNKQYSDFVLNKPYFIGKSSGTTGQPFNVPYSKGVYQKEYSFWWYHRSLCDIYRGDKIATFAGHKIADVRRNIPPFWLYNFAENQMFFSSYHLSMKNMPEYMMMLNRYKPAFIHGYPSTLYYIAKYILNEDVQLDFQPKMVVGSSETILNFQRKAIEEAFHTKLYVWYGNTEFCGHITECSHSRLHVQPYHSVVRILKDDNTDAKLGEIGRLVATNFSNYSLALINYDTKDIVKIGENQNCPCGKGGTVLDYIVGRIEDYIITPEGRFVGRLDHLFKDAKYVKNAQIVQKDVKRIIIRIEKEDGYSESIEKTILLEAMSRLGDTIDVQFQYVNEIGKEPNGKFKFVVQNIDLENIM